MPRDISYEEKASDRLEGVEDACQYLTLYYGV
jgi:hypothetical protein